MRWRVAIAGAGRVFALQRGALHDLAEHFELVGACDPDPVARAAAGLPTWPALADLVRAAAPDLVVVSTPLSAHLPVAAQALDLCCAVLVEKPVTTDLSELELLLAHADRVGRPLQAALHAAHAPDVAWLAEHGPRLWAGLGPVTGTHSRFLHPYLGPAGLDPATAGLGDAWLDLGINALSVLDRFVEDLALVDLHRAPLEATADLSFAGGRAVVETSWAAPVSHKESRLCTASGATVLLEHSRHRVALLHPDGSREVLFEQPVRPPRLVAHYRGVFAELLRVLNGAPDNRAQSRRLHRVLLG